MKWRSRRLLDTLIVLTFTALAAAGDLAGNVFAEAVPSTWTHYALPALGLLSLAEVVVALLLGNMQSLASDQDPRQRSRPPRGPGSR
jgi:hypothetical protein